MLTWHTFFVSVPLLHRNSYGYGKNQCLDSSRRWRNVVISKPIEIRFCILSIGLHLFKIYRLVTKFRTTRFRILPFSNCGKLIFPSRVVTKFRNTRFCIHPSSNCGNPIFPSWMITKFRFKGFRIHPTSNCGKSAFPNRVITKFRNTIFHIHSNFKLRQISFPY
jgi:hypothetical protein